MKLFSPLIISLAFAFASHSSHGQVADHDLYKSALGVRLGVYPGFTYKQFFSDVSAFELLAQFKFNGAIGALLYEAHFQAFGTPRMHWILGFGGHVAAYPEGRLKDPDGDVYEKDVTTIGIDGIFGLDYYFQTAPLVITFDIKPFFDLHNPGPNVWDAAVSIRFAF